VVFPSSKRFLDLRFSFVFRWDNLSFSLHLIARNCRVSIVQSPIVAFVGSFATFIGFFNPQNSSVSISSVMTKRLRHHFRLHCLLNVWLLTSNHDLTFRFDLSIRLFSLGFFAQGLLPVLEYANDHRISS
jgi:hypothetical protein